MTNGMDFNGADTQDATFDLIPANTLAKVCLTIRPGGAGPEGWLTQSKTSPALYLNTEAVVLEGPFARRRIYTRIGFRGKAAGGPGDDTYGNRGRALIRGILESARGVRADDQSEVARATRMISSLGDLSGKARVESAASERAGPDRGLSVRGGSMAERDSETGRFLPGNTAEGGRDRRLR